MHKTKEVPRPNNYTENRKPIKMTKMEIEELQTRTKGMCKEEQMIVLSSIPFDVVWEYAVLKINELNKKMSDIIKNAAQIINEGVNK